MGELSKKKPYFINPLILYIARLLNDNLRGILAQESLFPGQHTILMYVHSHPGCTQSELARSLDISLPSASVSVRRLEERGFLLKRPDPGDARLSRIELSELGRDTMDKIFGMMQAVEETLVDGMDAGQIDALRETLSQAIHNLHGEAPDWEEFKLQDFKQAELGAAGPCGKGGR